MHWGIASRGLLTITNRFTRCPGCSRPASRLLDLARKRNVLAQRAVDHHPTVDEHRRECHRARGRRHQVVDIARQRDRVDRVAAATAVRSSSSGLPQSMSTAMTARRRPSCSHASATRSRTCGVITALEPLAHWTRARDGVARERCKDRPASYRRQPLRARKVARAAPGRTRCRGMRGSRKSRRSRRRRRCRSAAGPARPTAASVTSPRGTRCRSRPRALRRQGQHVHLVRYCRWVGTPMPGSTSPQVAW